MNNNNTPELYLNNNPSYEVNTTKQVTIHQSETTYDVVSPPPSKQASGLPGRMQSCDKFNHRRQVKGRQHAFILLVCYIKTLDESGIKVIIFSIHYL